MTHGAPGAQAEQIEDLGAMRDYHLTEAEKITTHLREVVREAARAGAPETQLALAAGVSRMTIRKWLGK